MLDVLALLVANDTTSDFKQIDLLDACLFVFGELVLEVCLETLLVESMVEVAFF